MAVLPIRRSTQMVPFADPSREFEDLYDRMGQLINWAFRDAVLPRPGDGAAWIPAADLSETEDAYQVQVELPGASKDQIDVQLTDRELIISGEIPQPEERRRHSGSRHTGRFEHRTYLPGDIKPDQVSAKLADGVLTVTVPKSEAAKPRRIEVAG